MRDILRELFKESFTLGSYSPYTNVIHWNINVPEGGVISNWAHEFAHFMQFNGTAFGIAWNYLNRVRIIATKKLLLMLPKPIHIPIIKHYSHFLNSSDDKVISPESVEYLSLWIKADKLMKILLGEQQTNSAQETIYAPIE